MVPKDQKSDHDMLVELHGAICGFNGQDGLLRNFSALKKDHYKLKETFWKFFWIIAGVILVSGLSVGGIKLFSIVSGG